ncbi:CIA30 family protein [Thiomicrospira microaerophila]|uniref:CIA30 family protein n=1 Tax=Thiomicrospira microaerophila TaxID=406020 RepID=UPI0005CAE2E2|nr:CIA30 family protein [Thiomicrospira microaerophila]
MHYRLYPLDPLSADSGEAWDYMSDQVMGGLSSGQLEQHQEGMGWVTCLAGEVRLDNNGGFIQMQFDLSSIDNLARFEGLYLTWRGEAPAVAAHLKTTDLRQPWQSYKNTVFPSTDWKTDYWPFTQFAPYRTGIPLDVQQASRFGLLAIGQPGPVTLCVRELGVYRH